MPISVAFDDMSNAESVGFFVGGGTFDAVLALAFGVANLDCTPNPDECFPTVQGNSVDWTGDLTVKYTFTPIPVPPAAILFGTALAGLAAFRRRTTRKG